MRLNTLPFELLASRVGDASLAIRLVKELAQATGGQGDDRRAGAGYVPS